MCSAGTANWFSGKILVLDSRINSNHLRIWSKIHAEVRAGMPPSSAYQLTCCARRYLSWSFKPKHEVNSNGDTAWMWVWSAAWNSMPKREQNMLGFGALSNGGQRLSNERTAAPVIVDLSESHARRKYIGFSPTVSQYWCRWWGCANAIIRFSCEWRVFLGKR